MFQAIADTFLVLASAGMFLMPVLLLGGILEQYIEPMNFERSPKHDYVQNDFKS